MNQNPFSFYDFLGYLIPGGFFILLMYFCGLTFDLDIVIDLSELLRGQSQIFGILNYASIVIISYICLLYTSPSPRDYAASRMPSSA